MGRTVMGKYTNKQLEGLELFVYLMDRFNSTPEEALATMKKHGQDTGSVEAVIALAKTKQQQTERENNETND